MCHFHFTYSVGMSFLFVEYFYLPVFPETLRIDRGTETDLMAKIHCLSIVCPLFAQ